MPGNAALTFTVAAGAAGITPKALRGWMDRNQVQFPSLASRSEKTWRRFTLVDVLHLAIVGAIIKYDFRIEFADKIAREITGEITVDKRGMPDTASTARLKNRSIKLHHPQYEGAYSAANDEYVVEGEVEVYGEYLEVRPNRIFHEVCHRLTGADIYQIFQAAMADIASSLTDQSIPKAKKPISRKAKIPRKRRAKGDA